MQNSKFTSHTHEQLYAWLLAIVAGDSRVIIYNYVAELAHAVVYHFCTSSAYTLPKVAPTTPPTLYKH